MKERGYLRRQIRSRKKLDQQVLIYCWSKRTTVYSFFNQTALSISVLRISSSLTHSYVCLPKQRSLFFLRSCHCPKSFKSTNVRKSISKKLFDFTLQYVDLLWGTESPNAKFKSEFSSICLWRNLIWAIIQQQDSLNILHKICFNELYKQLKILKK